jgi:hypothetical protein
MRGFWDQRFNHVADGYRFPYWLVAIQLTRYCGATSVIFARRENEGSAKPMDDM